MKCQCCATVSNKTKRKILKCPGKDCTYAACRECHEKYFEIAGLKCMSCAMLYTPEHFTRMGLPKNWLRNDYFKHLIAFAFAREEQMLPLSLPEATTRKAIESHRKKINEIVKQGNHADTRSLRREYYGILHEFINETFENFRGNTAQYEEFIMNDANATVFKGHHAIYREQYITLLRLTRSKESHDAADQIQILKQAISELEKTLTKKSRVVYAAIHKCQTADCRGFLDANFACGLCGVNFCKRCRTPFGEGHVCDEDTVKTIEEIARTARSCPKCAVPITRTEGCDQMWCISCKTAFSWTTGEIVTSHIHNPHFFEWRRTAAEGGEAPREIGDIPCGGIPDMRILERFIVRVSSENLRSHDLPNIIARLAKAANPLLIYAYVFESYIGDVVRILEHISVLEQHHYRPTHNETFLNNCRVRYLMEKCTKEEFQCDIAKHEFTIIKKQLYQPILNTYVQVGAEIMRRITSLPEIGGGRVSEVKSVAPLQHLAPILKEFMRFHNYISGALHSMAENLTVSYNGKICINLNSQFHGRDHERLNMYGSIIDQFMEKYAK